MKMRKIAAAVLAAFTLSLFPACSDSVETVSCPASETSSLTSVSEKAMSEASSSQSNVFDDDYDPFEDSYDPYGGGSYLSAVTASSSSEITETSVTAEVSETMARELSAESNSKETQKKKDKDKKNDDKEISLEINSPNSWNDGKNDFAQYDFNVKNNSDKTLNG